METPKILLKKADEITEKLKVKYPELAPFFKNCFLNTIETTVAKLDDGGYFVITGDIPAMWLRDSASQLSHYIRYANEDEDLKEIIRSVIAKHAYYINIDPYANAFNAVPNSKSHKDETDFYHDLIWERKYEVDSLCASIYLAYQYYMQTLDASIFTEEFHDMLEVIIAVFKLEQNHFQESRYFFNRTDCPETDTLPNGGKGNEVAFTGMTWSGFRPSDDRCVYGYLVPSNMMAVCALKKAAELLNAGYEDTRLESECRSLAFDIDEGIKTHGVYEHEKFGKIYAYEVDGKGDVRLMDDANSPSLLSAPYLGYAEKDDEIYLNTRKFILSQSNPWYFEGSVAKGVGSPHTGLDKIWHIALTMQALTSLDEAEIKECINMLTTTHAGTFLMHESFNKNDDTDFTRPWFAWANSLFAELMIRLSDE
ncbi:MAG: glycoside hydrolase family 125 protein [Clostridia bacterium]|nr:glycoside hydrolase family 125 protein [Clostridia bacterium]MBO5432910.1 glycoside hydrolase family 125 protein [Clostridia bacterium]